MSEAVSVEQAILALAEASAFADWDVNLGHMLAEKAGNGTGLTEKQRAAGYRLLRKYADELEKVGVRYEDVRAPGEGYAPPSPEQVRDAQARRRVAVTVEDDRIHVRSPFRLKDVCKSVPAARWNNKKKCWTYPASPTSAMAVRQAFLGNPVTYDARFGELVAEADRQAEAQVHKSTALADLPPIPLTKTEPWEHQLQAFHFAFGLPAVCLALDMGTGKAQPLDALVLTPSGWRQMGELAAGDSVIGGNGRPTRVVAVHERGVRAVNAVTFCDGTVVRCCNDHLWNVQSASDAHKGKGWRTVDTRELMRRSENEGQALYVPLVGAVHFDSPDPLPLDPWLLGVLLGDGRLWENGAWITNADLPLVEGVEREVERLGCHLARYTEGNAKTYGIVTPRGTPNTVLEILRAMGLLGLTSRSKFVPEAYLRALPEERLALLQGLIDTDGHLSRGHCEYVSASRMLADAVVWIVRSLGGRATVVEKLVAGSVYFKVGLSLPSGMAFGRLARKAAPRHRQVRHRVLSVTPDGEAPTRCITVEAEDGLYVTEGFTVTHNSKVLVDLVTNWGSERVYIMCPTSVIDVWPKQFRLHAGRDFHVLALREGSVEARRNEADQALHECRCGRPHVVVINYEAAWREPFASWSIQQDWDVVACDESHRVKAPTGTISKHCYRVGRVARRRLALTGTPMSQTPLDVFGQYRFLDPDIFGLSYTSFSKRYAIFGGYSNYEVVGYVNQDELNEKFYSIAFRVDSSVLGLRPPVDVTRECQLSPSARRTYNQVKNELYAELEAGEITAPNVLVKMLRLQQITGGSVGDDAGQLHQVDEAKERLLEDVLSDLYVNEPVVVFCRFIHDLNAARRVALKTGRRYGELSGRQNDLTADATYPLDVDLLAVQVQSGGVGIDLSRSHYGIYYSLGFSLGDYQQTRKRLDRPGQDHAVVFTHLVAEGTIDADVYAALEANADVVNFCLRGFGRDR